MVGLGAEVGGRVAAVWAGGGRGGFGGSGWVWQWVGLCAGGVGGWGVGIECIRGGICALA